jgi:hypothetical protein
LIPEHRARRDRNRIMKVTVEVDCTPDEALRFLGLPDVVPMQQTFMEKLQQRMESASTQPRRRRC